MLIEKTILSYLEESGASYGDYCTLRYTDNGKLSSITIDTLKLNVFKSEVLLRVNNLLNESDRTEFHVPWGNLTGSKWLSGRGGSITIKAVPLGMASGGTESVFESVGINQSVHRIYFELRATVSLLTPFTQTDCELTSSVCIAETVIIGRSAKCILRLTAAVASAPPQTQSRMWLRRQAMKTHSYGHI